MKKLSDNELSDASILHKTCIEDIYEGTILKIQHIIKLKRMVLFGLE